jgi:hypothetical protein
MINYFLFKLFGIWRRGGFDLRARKRRSLSTQSLITITVGKMLLKTIKQVFIVYILTIGVLNRHLAASRTPFLHGKVSDVNSARENS